MAVSLAQSTLRAISAARGKGTSGGVLEIAKEEISSARARAVKSMVQGPTGIVNELVDQIRGREPPVVKPIIRHALDQPKAAPTPKPVAKETPLDTDPLPITVDERIDLGGDAIPFGGFGGAAIPTSFSLVGTGGSMANGKKGICDYAPGGEVGKAICRGIGGAVGDYIGTRGSGGGSKPLTALDPCKPGTIRVGNACVAIGDAFPGGAPLTTGAGGVAVMGGFGLPAMTPMVVGQVYNNRGELSLIRRCGPGLVLGRDDLCYPKPLLPRRSQLRKHRGQARPPMTAADAAALRRIGTLQKRVKGLASDAGLTCSRKGAARAGPPKKKR